MNYVISYLKKLSGNSWRIGQLLVVFASVVEILVFVYAYNLKQHYENEIKDIKVVLFVWKTGNINKIIKLAANVIGGNQKIIRPADAVKLLPEKIRKKVDESYIDEVPYIIEIHNSDRKMKIKRLSEVKKLLANYNASINYDESEIATILKKQNSLRITFMVISVLFLVINVLFGYIIRKIFIRESHQFASFLWNIGRERFADLISLLFFDLIAIVGSIIGFVIATMLLFAFIAGSVDIRLLIAGFLGIFVINIAVMSAASFKALR